MPTAECHPYLIPGISWTAQTMRCWAPVLSGSPLSVLVHRREFGASTTAVGETRTTPTLWVDGEWRSAASDRLKIPTQDYLRVRTPAAGSGHWTADWPESQNWTDRQCSSRLRSEQMRG